MQPKKFTKIKYCLICKLKYEKKNISVDELDNSK